MVYLYSRLLVILLVLLLSVQSGHVVCGSSYFRRLLAVRARFAPDTWAARSGPVAISHLSSDAERPPVSSIVVRINGGPLCRLSALFVAHAHSRTERLWRLARFLPVGSFVSVRRREDGRHTCGTDGRKWHFVSPASRKYSACTLRDAKNCCFL
jgi:hypothetical protein